MLPSQPVQATNGRLGVELSYLALGPPTETAIEMTWTLRWNDAVGYASEIGFSFGDGREVRQQVAYACQQGRDQSTIAHPAGVSSQNMAYRRPGQYQVRAWVVTSSCTGGDVRTEVGMPSPPIIAGTDLSNGPSVGYQVLSTQSRPGDDPALWKIHIRAGDPDGYIARTEITWGDGTADVVDHPLADCADPGSHWPGSVRDVEAQHQFPSGDRSQHAVTVRTTSVGCDGRDARHVGGVATSRVTVGPY